MNEFIYFLQENYPQLIALVGFVGSFLLNLVMWLRTRNIKYLLGGVTEEMKFKSRDEVVTRQAVDYTSSRFKKVFRYNKSTGELEETDEVVDLQEEIDSMRDYCLQACLERFECQYSDEISTTQQNVDVLQDDLDTLNSIYAVAEAYRDKYQLGDDVDIKDVFKAMYAERDQMKQHISALKEKQKGVTENETSAQTSQSSEESKGA